MAAMVYYKVSVKRATANDITWMKRKGENSMSMIAAASVEKKEVKSKDLESPRC